MWGCFSPPPPLAGLRITGQLADCKDMTVQHHLYISFSFIPFVLWSLRRPQLHAIGVVDASLGDGCSHIPYRRRGRVLVEEGTCSLFVKRRHRRHRRCPLSPPPSAGSTTSIAPASASTSLLLPAERPLLAADEAATSRLSGLGGGWGRPRFLGGSDRAGVRPLPFALMACEEEENEETEDEEEEEEEEEEGEEEEEDGNGTALREPRCMQPGRSTSPQDLRTAAASLASSAARSSWAI